MTVPALSPFSSDFAIGLGTAETLWFDPNNGSIVNEPSVIGMLKGCRENVQQQPLELDSAELAEWVRQNLNLAVSVACQGEQERRSRFWESAQEYQRKWEEVIAEVKRFLPLLRHRGVALYPTNGA